MFRFKSIVASLALGLSAIAAPASAWTLIPWNGTQVWGAAWTPSTVLSFAGGEAAENVWYRLYFEGLTDSYMGGNQNLPGLAATVLYKLSDVSTDNKHWTFQYEVMNASHAPVLQSRVSVIGFDFLANGQSLATSQYSITAVPGSHYTTTGENGHAPMQQGNFDVCLLKKNTPTANNCSGGSSGGPFLGETVGGAFTLNFNNAVTDFGLTNPYVRYQSLDFAVGASVLRGRSGVGDIVAYVPEPGTWALMILGFGGAGAMLRRHRSSSVAV